MAVLSDKQQEVLDQVNNLLSEHFDAHVIVFSAYDVDDEGHEIQDYLFAGGRAAAIGMCDMTSAAIMEKHLELIREDETED